MTRTPQPTQLHELLTLSSLKVRRAETGVSKQRAEVARYRQRLAEQQLLVDQLLEKTARVREFLAEPETASNPVRINDAYAHYHWLHYDLEQEEFYLKQMQQELQQAQALLTHELTQLHRLQLRRDEIVNWLSEAQRLERHRSDESEAITIEELALQGRSSVTGAWHG